VSGATLVGYKTPKVKIPPSNQFVDLVPGTILPPGTIVDLSGGAGIVLTDSQGNTMAFFVTQGVPAQFQITGQIVADRVTSGAKAAKPPVENLKLVGGNFASCNTTSLRGSAKAPPPVRRLWGKGKGNYRTQGRFAAATIRGTWWATVDRCDGTLIIVKEGTVVVRDLVTKKDHTVTPGHSYFAKKPKKK
jgi:hypothetical protein